MGQHWDGFEKGTKDSVIGRHIKEEHQGQQTPKFTAKITGSYPNALTRQLAESIQISRIPDSKRINSKTEFNHGVMARVELVVD